MNRKTSNFHAGQALQVCLAIQIKGFIMKNIFFFLFQALLNLKIKMYNSHKSLHNIEELFSKSTMKNNSAAPNIRNSGSPKLRIKTCQKASIPSLKARISALEKSFHNVSSKKTKFLYASIKQKHLAQKILWPINRKS